MDNKRSSRGKQISIYWGKCIRSFVNERQWTKLISSLIIVLIISMVTSDDMYLTYIDTKNGTFAVISACIWIGLFNSIQSICRERAIVKREHRTGLHISSYLLAHTFYEAALCAAESLIILLVLYIKNRSHMPESGLVFPLAIDLYISLFLVTLAADMMAMLISCIVKTETMAMTVMPFVLIIQLVMSGTVFALHGATEKISYATVSKWGMAAILSIAETNETVDMQAQMMQAESLYRPPTARALVETWGILAGFILIFLIAGIFFLRQVDRDQR